LDVMSWDRLSNQSNQDVIVNFSETRGEPGNLKSTTARSRANYTHNTEYDNKTESHSRN
jgi:hypothetical protein